MFKEFLDFKESVFSILSKTCNIKVGATKVSILRVESLSPFSAWLFQGS